MTTRRALGISGVAIVLLGMSWLSPVRRAEAHCDTMDGPVVKTAQAALEKGDVTPVLKWVKPEYEAQIREAFKKTLAVRGLGKDARDLADMYFFETLVRLHREGEGAPYTGLKPGGAVEPIMVACDKALETGSVDELSQEFSQLVAEGIRHRFAETLETKRHADENVAAGREFVRSYVEFTHYVERLHTDATSSASHEPAAEKPGCRATINIDTPIGCCNEQARSRVFEVFIGGRLWYSAGDASAIPLGDQSMTRTVVWEIVIAILLAFGPTGSGAEASGKVVTYPAPAGDFLSSDYQVQAGGQKVDVYGARVLDPPFAGKEYDYGGPYSFANFDMAGPVAVRITSERSLRNTVIRPQSAEVRMTVVDDHTLSLTLDRPCKFSVEPDGRKGPLLLFANPLETDAPKAGRSERRLLRSRRAQAGEDRPRRATRPCTLPAGRS